MATHKVGLAGVESGHQLNQGDKVDRGDSLAATLLLLLAVILGGGGWLTRVVFPQENQQGIGRLALHDFDNRVVDGVLVLLEPSSDVVGHDSSVVGDGEVGVLVGLGLGLQEDGKLTQGGLEFFLERLVGRLWEERLLLEDGPDAHGLLKHDDGSSQVHAEVHHDPVNTFLHILLLFNNEHVVVKELLELLVHKIDGDLFESVVLKDLKSGNIKHSTEVCLLEGGINKGIVTLLDEPLEDTVKDCPGNTSSGHGGLLAGLTLDHPLSSDLDPGLAESLEESNSVHTKRSSSLSSKGLYSNVLDLCLVIMTFGLINNTTAGHDTSSQDVTVKLLLLTEAENIEGILSVEQLLVVIDGIDLGLTLRDVDVVVDISTDKALGPQSSWADAVSVRLQQLVEDMVGSLHLLLLSDTGLLQQVGHDVTTGQLARGCEVDTDELSESGGVVVPGGLSITVGFQDGVGGHNLVFKRYLLLILLSFSTSGHHGQVGDHLLGVLRFASTRLSGDQHSVVLFRRQHIPVSALSNGPQVGRGLVPPLAEVNLTYPVGIQWVTFVGVNDHHKQTRVGVDQLGLVASLQVPEDRGVIKIGKVDHVLAFLKLGRVDT